MAIGEAGPASPAGFSAEVRAEGDATSVLLTGELDLATAGAVREALVRPEVLTASRVRVDLTEVAYMDSSSIGVLVSACKRVKESGGTFSVVCRRNEPRRVLEVSGLLEYLNVEEAA